MTSRVLIVAATEPELRGATQAGAALACGVGPVAAAAQVAHFLAFHDDVDLVLHIGIAGASRASGLQLLDAVVGESSRYCDTSSRLVQQEISCPDDLVSALAGVARRVPSIGTSADVGGTSHTAVSVEAMEGFGVLWAAANAGVPAVEVRVLSNWIDEPDRSCWLVDEALERLADLTPQLVDALAGVSL